MVYAKICSFKPLQLCATKQLTMPTYSSQQLLQKLQTQTEILLDTAISQWQMMPHNIFARKPGAESWSANECIQHLNSYGCYYLPAIEKAIRNSTTAAEPEFTAGWLGNYFTKLMQPSQNGPMKKMKSPKDHQPTVILPSHEVISEFISQQEKLLQLLRAAASVNLDKNRVPVSISKWIKLKLGDTFHFLIVHEYRHFLQAQKALELVQELSVINKVAG